MRDTRSAPIQPEPEPPHVQQRHQDLLARHLRAPVLALHEHDRHLAEREAGPESTILQLHEEGVAVRPDVIEMGFDPEIVLSLSKSSTALEDQRAIARYQDEEWGAQTLDQPASRRCTTSAAPTPQRLYQVQNASETRIEQGE